MTKIKTRATKLRVPQNKGELGDMLIKFGEAYRRTQRQESEMNDLISEVKEEYNKITADDRDYIKQATKAIQSFAEANRDDLTDGKQHYEGANAFLRWRLRPAKVSIKNVEDVIKHILSLGGEYQQFLRKSHEIDKENILKHKILAEDIDGITVKSEGENFTIELKDEALPDGTVGE